MTGYWVIDRNDRETTICTNTDVARDAAQVLEGKGHIRVAYRINAACAGMRAISDSTIILDTIDMPAVDLAIRAVA
jgi:hypothetical protein